MNAVIAAGITKRRFAMKVLSPVKHHKFSLVLHHGRIKRSSRLEAVPLGRNDRLVGLSIPLSEGYSELGRGRSSDHCQSCNAYVTSAGASQTALHSFISFQYLGASGFLIRSRFAQTAIACQKSTERRKNSCERSFNVSGTTFPLSVIRTLPPLAGGILMVAARSSVVGLYRMKLRFRGGKCSPSNVSTRSRFTSINSLSLTWPRASNMRYIQIHSPAP